jgi:predicted transposase YbfD/YdcC
LPKKTFEAAKEANAILIVQVKDNQETLRKQLEHGMKIQKSVDKFGSDWELAHGRIEQRFYEVFEASTCLRKFPEWKEIHQMIRVQRVREIKGGKQSIEEAVYACNNELSAKEYAKYIREHWGIENKLNYVKDVSFLEDSSKRHINPVNFSTCISFALNIIRRNFNFYSKKPPSIRGILVENAMKIENVLNYVT